MLQGQFCRWVRLRRSDMSEELEKARKQTALELRIDKIWQKLFWYDNVPPDEDIVSLLMEWRECRRQLKELGVSNVYTN